MRLPDYFLVFLAPLALVGCATSQPASTPATARAEVIAAEAAFAATMAKRDHAAFAQFVADEAIFFGSGEPLRGRQQVVDGWARYFETNDAPFSWQPELVDVLDSGTLALSSGPVYNADGTLIARFTSIWRREDEGWRVVFDKGSKACD